jgi:hypothetical protein
MKLVRAEVLPERPCVDVFPALRVDEENGKAGVFSGGVLKAALPCCPCCSLFCFAFDPRSGVAACITAPDTCGVISSSCFDSCLMGVSMYAPPGDGMRC